MQHKHHSSHHVTAHKMVGGEHSPKEVAKFVAVIASIFLVSFIVYSLSAATGFMEWMRWFMGVFFVVFAGFKFAGYAMFAQMFTGYDVIAKRFKPYAYVYPFIELFLGALYIFDIAPLPRDIATVVIMGVSAIGVFQEIKKRSGIHCACLGNIIKLPLSTVSFVENASMGVMALAMIFLR